MKQGKQGIYARYIKRILDVLLSGCALVVLSPVLLIVAVLVRTKLGSPVIFCQERPGKNDKIFKKLITLGRTNEILHRWAEQAGIKKHITFHTARHTHATMLLTLGVDLYTVSKLLGHTNIQTTQVYAKLVDESKKKAIDLIPNIT